MLKNTPLQHVRLRFTLAERFLAQGKEEEAYECYKSMLTECADYPGILSVYQKLIPLAKKLGKRSEARRWEEEMKPFLPPPATNAATPPKR